MTIKHMRLAIRTNARGVRVTALVAVLFIVVAGVIVEIVTATGTSYVVSYSENAPSGCTVTGMPTSATATLSAEAGATVRIANVTPTMSCTVSGGVSEGWQFEGWEITTDGVTKFNDSYFRMPENTVVLRAIWGKATSVKAQSAEPAEIGILFDTGISIVTIKNTSGVLLSTISKSGESVISRIRATFVMVPVLNSGYILNGFSISTESGDLTWDTLTVRGNANVSISSSRISPGQTWAEWAESDDNTGDYKVHATAYGSYAVSDNSVTVSDELSNVIAKSSYYKRETYSSYDLNYYFAVYDDTLGAFVASDQQIDTSHAYSLGTVYERISNTCVSAGTLVTVADGSKRAIEDVEVGDEVMTWSFWNGRYESMPVTHKFYHGDDTWNVLTLHFSDDTEVRTITEHGFFDVDENTYSYIRPDNVDSFIGHHFIKYLPGGSSAEVTLESYAITAEVVGSYSLQTAYNENFIVEDILSITGEPVAGRFEYFTIGDNMKYDEDLMLADIERYGLYSYDEWSEYMDEDTFEAVNGKYFKVLVGRGVFTYESLVDFLHEYLYN